MKTQSLWLTGTVTAFFALNSFAVPRYVDLNNLHPAPPYTAWGTAATNIQDAINVCADGDEVVVTNGIYQTGGKVMSGDLTNRVAIDKAITVRSVNGPWVTVIQGEGPLVGATAVRCAWLTNGAVLQGFTLQGGGTRSTADPNLGYGGAAWCAGAACVFEKCVVQNNTAYLGCVYRGRLHSCLVRQNLAVSAVAMFSVLENCTFVNNAGTAVASVSATNCLLAFNASLGNGVFSYCCSYPTFLGGVGNFSADPLLLEDGFHLGIKSPCGPLGTNLVYGTDLDGQPWAGPPSIGCDQWLPEPVLVQPHTDFPPARGFRLSVTPAGQPPFTYAWIKDGQPLPEDGHYSSPSPFSLLVNPVRTSDAGGYQAIVTNDFGSVTSAVLQVAIHCVDAGATGAVPPYSTWATAASNIQDAIDAALPGAIVLVTNGLYARGGKVTLGDLTNRVALDKSLLVQSVNGPLTTCIQGVGPTNGTAAVRCAWLTNGAVLRGFTLERGATRNVPGDLGYGGGAWCAGSNAVVESCIIRSNTAASWGGGVYQGRLHNCALVGNKANSGGGAYISVLKNCTVLSNSTYGTFGGALTNCIVYYNSNANFAGGSFAYCCTTNLPAGAGNISAPPQLFPDNLHLAVTSPCRSAGTTIGMDTDLLGYDWGNPPCIGCTEWQPAPFLADPALTLSGDPPGVLLSITLSGQAPFTYWYLRDGQLLAGSGPYELTPTDITVPLNPGEPGVYQLIVSNAFGCVTSAPAVLAVHFVAPASPNPTAPFTTWATAATNIQDAIDAAAAGEVVLVTNGLYASGGKSMDGVITNRISIDKEILVQSVNGPESTVIQGAWDPASTNGPAAIRCAWLTNRATLAGFTLTRGATRALALSPNQSMSGGGALATSNNAVLYHCVISTNFASNVAGGAYGLTLSRCALVANHAVGSGRPGGALGGAGSGGGAASCNLKNCLLTANFADALHAGGALGCNSTNCAFVGNRAWLYGSAAYSGLLVNCTAANNTSGGYGAYGGAVAGAGVSNSIIYGNFNIGPGATNHINCTFTYSDTDPLPSGMGNTNVDPQFVADFIHLAQTSPCRAAARQGLTSGTDIDGQYWSNPPSMGCDEWQPQPVFAVQPTFKIKPGTRLQFASLAAGQPDFAFAWNKDGTAIHDDGHHAGSTTASLVVNNFGPEDAGLYQAVVTNAFGSVTSRLVHLVIHVVDLSSSAPVSPFTNWPTAATNIQDAIDAAGAGEIVLVTNGVYATGGKVIADNFTNRIAIDKPLTVISANGFAETVIQGAWDPLSTNGPGALRCVYLSDGAVLSGFTLRNGATRTSGYPTSMEGGGVWATSTNAVVSNCVLSNNFAINGGGISRGTLNNSFVVKNVAESYGGGAYFAVLNNCTVINNRLAFATPYHGAGTYDGSTRNSIVDGNYYGYGNLDNYGSSWGALSADYSYSSTYPLKSGPGNIDANEQFLDLFHISSTSPCRGAGSPLYATEVDVDNEPWAEPPSMGCDEVILANLTGPLSLRVFAPWTNLIVNLLAPFDAVITGRASRAEWDYGDGTIVTNIGSGTTYRWSAPGDYPLTFTAFNLDHPSGVSATINIHVEAVRPAALRSAVLLTNGFQFEFIAQTNVSYTIQYATNLAPPVSWQTLQSIYYNQSALQRIIDPVVSNSARFYRVLAN